MGRALNAIYPGVENIQFPTAFLLFRYQVGHRDLGTQKLLLEVKNETGKVGLRLSDMIKPKASEKMLLKVEHTLEEMKKDSINDMKTLSTMNTTLQVIWRSPINYVMQVPYSDHQMPSSYYLPGKKIVDKLSAIQITIRITDQNSPVFRLPFE